MCFPALMHWMRESGANIDSVSLCSKISKHNLPEVSLHATRDIAKGNTVIAVPSHILISRELAMASAIGQRLLASGVVLNSDDTFLAAFLLQERDNQHSTFRPYLDTLPESFPHIPLFWPHAFIDRWLEGSMVVGQIEEKKQRQRSEYSNVCRALPGFGAAHSYERFAWARAVVASRQFRLGPVGPAGPLCHPSRPSLALVPLADLLQPPAAALSHRAADAACNLSVCSCSSPAAEPSTGAPLTAWRFDPSFGVCVSAAQPLRQSHTGGQLALTAALGRKCNSRLLLTHGVAHALNPCSGARVECEVPRNAHAGNHPRPSSRSCLRSRRWCLPKRASRASRAPSLCRCP